MNIPQVSVLITAFNREEFIGFAIQSVLDSTFADFEVIIVDDCSSDNTLKIARNYQMIDSRIKVYVNDRNLGDYANRNKCASFASGKYLKFIDSDDYVYPTGLEIMWSAMERFPESVIGVCTLPMSLNSPYPFQVTPLEMNEMHFCGKLGIMGMGPLSYIIRRDFFESVNGFDEVRMVSDYKFWLNASLKGNYTLIQDGVIWNRIHAGQELRDKHKFEDLYFTININHWLELKSYSNDLVKKIRKRQIRQTIKTIIRSFFKFDFAYILCLMNRLYRIWNL